MPTAVPAPPAPFELVPRALTGVTVVVTRPTDSARGLLARVRRAGGIGLALPGVGLREPDAPQRARDELAALADAEGWIFSSPAAVRFTFRLVPGWQPRGGAKVLAIGSGSARALAAKGVTATVPSERVDSEGLLALPALAKVDRERFVLLGAPGGRDVIAPELRARGATVTEIAVYRRVTPRLDRRHFTALAAAAEPLIVLLSSAEAITNLVAALPADALSRLRGATAVASSPRLAAAAGAAGFARIVVSASAQTDHMLQAVAQVCAT